MTFVLDATNKAIKFTITAGASSDVHFTSHWADATASGLTEGQTQGTSNGSTSVDAVPAPAASTRRVIKLITFYNTNASTARSVTLVNDVGGTSRTIATFSLAPLATWYSDTASTTAIADGDKGDITVSGSGATWTIDNDAITTAKILNANVTLAKIENITANSLLGRDSNSSGVPGAIATTSALITWLKSPSSVNLAAAVTDETGSGALVFATAPTITSPTVSSGDVTVSNGNIKFDGTAKRFIARFSGTPLFDRFAFQTDQADSGTVYTIMPNGTAATAGLLLSDRSTSGDYAQGQIVIGAADLRVGSRATGSGATAKRMFLHTVDVERIAIELNGNIGFNGSSYGSGVGVIFIANATTVPTGNPSGGGILYTESGALKYRGAGGKVTTIAESAP